MFKKESKQCLLNTLFLGDCPIGQLLYKQIINIKMIIFQGTVQLYNHI